MAADSPHSSAPFDIEERLAFLERHVQQQDREIYAQSEQIRRLQMLLQQLRGQLDAAKAGGMGEPREGFPAEERPPHY